MEKNLSTKADAKALFARFNKTNAAAAQEPEPEVKKVVKQPQKPIDKAVENREMLEQLKKEALAEMEAEKQPQKPIAAKKAVSLDIPDKLQSIKEREPEPTKKPIARPLRDDDLVKNENYCKYPNVIKKKSIFAETWKKMTKDEKEKFNTTNEKNAYTIIYRLSQKLENGVPEPEIEDGGTPRTILNNSEYLEMYEQLTADEQAQINAIKFPMVMVSTLKRLFKAAFPDEQIEAVEIDNSAIENEIAELQRKLALLKAQKNIPKLLENAKLNIYKAIVALAKLTTNKLTKQHSNEIELFIHRLEEFRNNILPEQDRQPIDSNENISNSCNFYYNLLEPEPENEEDEPEDVEPDYEEEEEEIEDEN